MASPPKDPDFSNNNNQNFLLGEINATVKGTADDVKAIRTDVGDLARRVAIAENEITDIKSDRAAMKPEYMKFVHKTNNHMQADIAWKASTEAEVKTSRRILHIAYLCVVLLISLVVGIAKIVIG